MGMIISICCIIVLILVPAIGLTILIWWLIQRNKKRNVDKSAEDWDVDDDEIVKEGEFTEND
ncbi:MAG: hypothetical protein ACMUIG_01240 [Thermoplasmatota archaeon]